MESKVREAEQAAARKGKCDLRETRAEAERTAAEAKGAPVGSPLQQAAKQARDALANAEKVHKERG